MKIEVRNLGEVVIKVCPGPLPSRHSVFVQPGECKVYETDDVAASVLEQTGDSINPDVHHGA